MSGGYRGKPPTDYAELMADLNQLKTDLNLLKNKRSTTAGITATNVVLTDANGVRWRLGVTTSGATTWTQV